MADPELPDSIAGNIADWTRSNADLTDAQADAAWAPPLAGLWIILPPLSAPHTAAGLVTRSSAFPRVEIAQYH